MMKDYVEKKIVEKITPALNEALKPINDSIIENNDTVKRIEKISEENKVKIEKAIKDMEQKLEIWVDEKLKVMFEEYKNEQKR